jgi:predicted RNA-binding Zn-ribbon protein involved in translation (DUF1610 family)
MQPNYSDYSIAELEQALVSIDKEAFPEREARIKEELMSRHSAEKSKPGSAEDNFEPNEQFFKCPTCEKKIGLFSKTANSWGKEKVCPHCNSPFESFVKLKVFLIVIIPALFVHILVLQPLVVSLGLNGVLSNVILCGILLIFTMRYRKVRGANVK